MARPKERGELSSAAKTAMLRDRVREAEETIEALRSRSADALVGIGPAGERVWTLEGTEHPHRLMVETMGEGAVTLSPDCVVLYHNNSFAELLKCEPKKLMGSHLHDWIERDDVRQFDAFFHLNNDETKREYLRLKRTDGELIPVQITIRSLAPSGVQAIIAIVTDMSEMERARGMKDRFLANMSHELRTPLTTVIGYAGTLLKKLPGPLTPEQEKQISVMRSSARHLSSMIDDLLELAQVDAGAIKLNRETLVCQEVVKELAQRFTGPAEEKGLRFELDMPVRPVMVSTDRHVLDKVLRNFLKNAIAFTQAGFVRVRVESGRNGSSAVCLSVADSGIGIAEKNRDKVFQAFARLTTERNREEGTGLGLHLSQKLAQLVGGKISYESAEGKGSTFTLTLRGT